MTAPAQPPGARGERLVLKQLAPGLWRLPRRVAGIHKLADRVVEKWRPVAASAVYKWLPVALWGCRRLIVGAA